MTEDEKRIEKAIEERMAIEGILCWNVSNGRRGRIRLGVWARGRKHRFPDLLCCVRGRFVAMEVKAPGKEKRGDKERLAEQANCRRDITDHAGLAEVVTSVEEAMAVIERARMEAVA